MKNLIFDFGNVLVRWQPELVFLPYFNNDEQEWKHFWNDIMTLEWRNRIDAGESNLACIAELQKLHPQYAEAIALYYKCWDEMLTGEVPGMHEILTEIKAHHLDRYRIFGLTNWSNETFPLARKRFGILQEIDNYVVSGVERLVKPDPRIFELLLNRYGLKAEESIFIDDNAANVAAANKLGIAGKLFIGADDLRQYLNL